MSAPAGPAYLTVGSIFIDDIVFPDGQTRMGVLGGGASHAAAGMAIWGTRGGIVACIGRDLPEDAHQRLARDFDLSGVVWRDLPQARAWQIFEWDGRRTEIFRMEELAPFADEPYPAELPAAFCAAKGVHLLRDARALPDWRAFCPEAVLMWEPQQHFMLPANAPAFRAALPLVDIVSPNQLEAGHLYGFDDPEALVRTMLADGAALVVLRMGEDGSLVGQRGRDELIAVPPVPVPQIVDQTGAGNTYCGAFLVAWVETGDLRTATCRAAVAASFALETLGVIDPPTISRTVRDERCAWLQTRLVVPQPH